MDRSCLENLLRLPGYDHDKPIADVSVLTCGCLTSESWFRDTYLDGSSGRCPNCHSSNVSILAEVKPLRNLYYLLQTPSQSQLQGNRRRRSSSKKSFKHLQDDTTSSQQHQKVHTFGTSPSEATDLITLFHKFAKEEQYNSNNSRTREKEKGKERELARDRETRTVKETETEKEKERERELEKEMQKERESVKETTHTSTIEIPGLRADGKQQPIESQIGTSYPSTLSMGSLTMLEQARGSLDPISALAVNHNNDLTNLNNKTQYESLFEYLNEQKEYNFSKCFPFHRKLLSYPTQQMKLNLGAINPFKTGSYIKRAICSSIVSFLDYDNGLEITRFVLMSEKKWELYEYVTPMKELDVSHYRPKLLCCGKLTGEYGTSFNALVQATVPGPNEVVKRSTFNSANVDDKRTAMGGELKKRLASWDQLYCQLSKNYMVILGTKGVMRVINVRSGLKKVDMGELIYTYLTDFPIRCFSVSPNERLIACGLTARERILDKEQPFIVLHRLNEKASVVGADDAIDDDDDDDVNHETRVQVQALVQLLALEAMNEETRGLRQQMGMKVNWKGKEKEKGKGKGKGNLNANGNINSNRRANDEREKVFEFDDPLTITIPFRDPIKIINFNAASTHIICATVWEPRYIIIKLKSFHSLDYRKPRLIWSDIAYKSGRRTEDTEMQNSRQDELMMANEGTTDIQFDDSSVDLIVICSSSLTNRPPQIIHIEGAKLNSGRMTTTTTTTTTATTAAAVAAVPTTAKTMATTSKAAVATDTSAVANNIAMAGSMSNVEEYGESYASSHTEEESVTITSSEVVMRFNEIGSSIHRTALSPRGDGIIFLDKDGKLLLVSLPHHGMQGRSKTTKKVIVLLGEVANAERFSEAASVKFSADGGKVFTLDRKGVFSVFDFTKGVPGEDLDVVKCKILSLQ